VPIAGQSRYVLLPVLRRFDPVKAYGVRLTLLGLAVALVGIPMGWLLHQVTTDGPMTAFDESLAQDLHAQVVDSPAMVDVLQVISFTGKPIFLVLVVGLPCVWLLRHRAYRLILFLILTSIGGGIVDTIVKVAVGRPRPSMDQPVAAAFGHSFPSGHSMSSTICYGAVFLVFAPWFTKGVHKVALAVTIAIPLLIGFSRLALGVHFLSDVLGGYVLGLAWLIASVAAFEIYRVERGRPKTEPTVEGVEPEDLDVETEHSVPASVG
jgi:membrane-associated phospholipid phosphatase